MSIFRSIVFTSVLVGVIAGASVSVVHYFTTEPLILAAEVYESAGEATAPPATHSHEAPAADATAVPAHSHDAAATTAAPAHEHDEEAWGPADGFERYAYTLAANILTATGFSLMLNGLFYAAGRPVSWRQGLIWGLGGFVAVMLAPGLGLHPELPGTPAAPLFDRQLWWIGTALATAIGLALLAFNRTPWSAALAMVLIVAPHVIGAPPAPEGVEALAPAALEHRFVVLATMTSLMFWALLGTLSGYFHRRFEA